MNSEVSESELRRLLDVAFSGLDFVYSVMRPRKPFHLCRYLVKTIEHARKRVYLAPWVRLDRIGTVGTFWAKPPNDIWEGVKQQERAISATVKNHPDIGRAAIYLSGLTERYVPARRIRRSLALDFPTNQQAVRQWAEAWLEDFNEPENERHER